MIKYFDMPFGFGDVPGFLMVAGGFMAAVYNNQLGGWAVVAFGMALWLQYRRYCQAS